MVKVNSDAVKESHKHCLRKWNVRSMSQGKLEVVKEEMTRVNIDILGISELRWTGTGEFNSDDHYIYNCRHESLRRNGEDIIVNKAEIDVFLKLFRNLECQVHESRQIESGQTGDGKGEH